MSLYLDTAYVAKCYLNEPDASRVRSLVRGKPGLTSSALCTSELACILHRHVHDGELTRAQASRLRRMYDDDVEGGVWTLLPVTGVILDEVARRVAALHVSVYIRSADAIHLTSAADAGFREVWTSDRHMLAAAKAFGLVGRSAP